jgi:hypothetical protein
LWITNYFSSTEIDLLQKLIFAPLVPPNSGGNRISKSPNARGI